jgi:copper oxidase (laccase) domain-containing protein
VDIRTIREERLRPAVDGPVILVHPGWLAAWPGLIQGTTTRDRNFALAAGDPTVPWSELTGVLGCRAAVHARQPHGTAVGVRAPAGPGLHLATEADGHLTRAPDVLLGVTTADCVPVTLLAPEPTDGAQAVAIIHAGWRGAAAGILQRGLARMATAFGVPAGALLVHFGPSICGDCYEVGPEVHEALGLERPRDPRPVDLVGVLAQRAVEGGVDPDRITRSSWCTRCTGRELLHSHRGGDAGRQVSFVAIAGHGRDAWPPSAPARVP